jgi:hypothetical protein
MAIRSAMRTNARARADQDSSTFPTDVQYNMYLDKSAAHVWRKLVAAGWKPDRTTVTVTANGSTAYTVGTDVGIVLSIQRVDGQTRIDVPRVKPEDLAGFLTQGTGVGLRYDLIGGGNTTLQVEFYPKPSSGSYEVKYIKKFPGFTSDSDTWFGPDGSDELVEIGAAIRGLKKEGGWPEEVAALEAEFKDLYAEICQHASWLDSTQPQTIRDATQNQPYDAYDWQATEGWY